MGKAKRTLSVIMAALMLVFTCMTYVPANAAEVLPKVSFVGLENIPAAVGEEQTLMLTSKDFTGDVQYQVFYVQRNDPTKKTTTEWTKLNDWTPAADAKTPVEVKISKTAVTVQGNYSFAIRVKRAGTEGTYSNSYGKYDNAYCFNYVFAATPTEGLKAAKVESATIQLGQKFAISGLTAGKSYKLFTFNEARAQKWDKEPVATTATADKLEWAPTEVGNYVLDVQLIGADGKFAAVKLFNVKVIPADKLSVESVKAVTTKISNPISGYTDTVLVGHKALIEARVVDKDGKGVPGVTVVFTEKKWNGHPYLLNYVPVQTNIDGVASCVALTDAENDTDDHAIGSIQYEASVVGTSVASTGLVKFAAIKVNKVVNVNTANDDPDDETTWEDNIIPSTNAPSLEYFFPAQTEDMNGTDVEYVASQQVSKSGKSEHAITFTAKPQLVLPAAFGATNVNTYKQDIPAADGVSGEYHPYANWTKTYTVEAGLKYATLNISKLQLAPYSKFTVDVVTSAGVLVRNLSTINGAYDAANFGIQIPTLASSETYVRVKLQSPGQVRTDLNDGAVITSITGVYSNEKTVAGDTIDLPGATIKWETTPVVYSDPQLLQNPNLYITTESGYNASYSYSYQVPVFPYTGDAVIIGRNANGDIKQYYLFPTVNNDDNQNVLASFFNYQAILATQKEATTSVGSITQDGNDVTINSAAVGYTEIKGTISVPGLGSDVFDATNNTLYTSVQWAPLPIAGTAAAANTHAYALVGQNITITAQLVDANDNPVSQNNVQITWDYNNDVANPATEVLRDAMTDVNGQARITLTDGAVAKVTDLTADAPDGYKAVLKIGDKTVETADLYWANAGLYYMSELTPVEFGPAYSQAITAATSSVSVGKTVEYAYKLKGKDVDGNTVVITGVPVNFTNENGVGSMTPGTGLNFTATSNNAGILQVNGMMGAPTGKVTFAVTNASGTTTEYDGAGEGTTSMYSSMLLPITFGTVGQQIAFVNPLGLNIADTTTTVYAKLTDKLGNPLNVASGVTVTVTGNATVVGPVPTATDNNGVVTINLAKGVALTGPSVVTVKYGDNTVSETINWINPTLVAFDVVNAGLNASGTNDVIALTFSRPVNAASVNAAQFSVANGATVYGIKKAEVAGNIVYLTLADSNAKLPQTTKTTYTVTINSTKVLTGVNSGITYQLADNYGRKLADGATESFTIPSATTVAAELAGSTLTIHVREANIATGVAAAVTLVSSDLNAFAAGGNGITSVTTANGEATLTLNNVQVGSVINVYYNGQMYTLYVH